MSSSSASVDETAHDAQKAWLCRSCSSPRSSAYALSNCTVAPHPFSDAWRRSSRDSSSCAWLRNQPTLLHGIPCRCRSRSSCNKYRRLTAPVARNNRCLNAVPTVQQGRHRLLILAAIGESQPRCSAARTSATNCSALSEAPPISPPSIPGCASSDSTFCGFMEPP